MNRWHDKLVDDIERRVGHKYSYTQREVECWKRNKLLYVADFVGFKEDEETGLWLATAYEAKTGWGRKTKQKIRSQGIQWFTWADYRNKKYISKNFIAVLKPRGCNKISAYRLTRDLLPGYSPQR